MKKTLKQRGQKFLKRFSRASEKVEALSRENIQENLIDRLPNARRIRLLIFEWVLLISALILLAVAQMFWFKNSYSTEAATAGGTYIEGTIGKVNSLNPLFATTTSEKTLSRLLFATLSTNDYSGHPGAGLAKTITSSEDGKIWTVKLRENLKWSDGEPITNADIIFTANLLQNSAVASIYSSNLTNVKVSENENGEIVFTLSSAYADFISALNFPILPEHILKDVNPKNLAENNFSLNPVTSGPFSLNAIQTVNTSGEKIYYLSANPNYYKGEPLISTFAVHIYLDEDSLLAALNAGSITATADLTSSDAKITSKNLRTRVSDLNSGVFLFMNTSNLDKSARTAIRSALDLDKIREIADSSALDYPFLKSQISLSSYPEIPTANFAESSKYFSENLSEKSFVLATVNSGSLPVVAAEIASELQSLGLSVTLKTYDENQDFVTNVINARNYDLLLYEIELGADPDLLPYYHSSQASSTGLNLSNYKNSLVDDLILGARTTTDLSLRAKKYESFLNYWVNDAPAVALYQSSLTYYYNKNAQIFSEDLKLVTPLDRFSDVASWSVTKTSKNRTP